MVQQVTQRYGHSSELLLVDGGYPVHGPLDDAATQILVFTPVPNPQDPSTHQHVAKDADSQAVGAWRELRVASSPRMIGAPHDWLPVTVVWCMLHPYEYQLYRF